MASVLHGSVLACHVRPASAVYVTARVPAAPWELGAVLDPISQALAGPATAKVSGGVASMRFASSRDLSGMSLDLVQAAPSLPEASTTPADLSPQASARTTQTDLPAAATEQKV
jgi:hypothetical protein